MYGMFGKCKSLKNVDLSQFSTHNVTSMKKMFLECAALTILDLSSFDTNRVDITEEMFKDCTELTKIYASSRFDVSSALASSDMFTGCAKLKGGAGTEYNASNVDKTYACIDSTDSPGYFTAKSN